MAVATVIVNQRKEYTKKNKSGIEQSSFTSLLDNVFSFLGLRI